MRAEALLSLALGLLAGCASSGSHGSPDASVPTDGPVATDGRGSEESGADVDTSRADVDAASTGESGPTDAGEGGPDTSLGDDGSDTTGEGGDADATSGFDALADSGGTCPTECSDAAGSACSTPDVAGNPPVPAGYRLLPQAQVTSAMTTWATGILHDPSTYPMFSCAIETFGTLSVLARVEWQAPDFQNSAVHRGVVLYEQGD